jgi:hypothetical protein
MAPVGEIGKENLDSFWKVITENFVTTHQLT